MAGFLPPVVAVLVADTAEYTAGMDKAIGKMGELDAATDTAGAKFTKFGGLLSDAVLGGAAAFAAFGVDKAVKMTEALDTLQNQTNVTAGELSHIKNVSIALSDQTGKSAVDIVGAYQAVETAGYKRAAADAAVAAATKLAVIADTTAASAIQSLVAAQNLGLTKGMSAAKVADILTIALKGNEGGLSGVVNLLSGTVGAAFAGYHQSVGEAVAVANEFSLAGITQTRQIATFVQKLGTLQGPMKTTEIENGKLTTTSASYVNSLRDVGLNVDKTKDAFTGPNGLVNGLLYLKTTADGSLPKLEQYLTAIFGATGVGGGMALINHLKTLKTTIDETSSASGTGLTTAFNTAAGQFGNQMKIIETNLENAAMRFGYVLLPDIEKAATFLENALQSLNTHPGERKALEIDLGGTVLAALGVKLLQTWNNSRQTTLLADIARNTSVTATAAEAGDAEGGAAKGLAGGALAGLSSATLAALGIAAAGAYSVHTVVKNPGSLLDDPISKLNHAIGSWIDDIDGANHSPRHLYTKVPGRNADALHTTVKVHLGR